jgi:hypothetical protein
MLQTPLYELCTLMSPQTYDPVLKTIRCMDNRSLTYFYVLGAILYYSAILNLLIFPGAIRNLCSQLFYYSLQGEGIVSLQGRFPFSLLPLGRKAQAFGKST